MHTSKLLPSCTDDKKFYALDGSTYTNLYQLRENLITMNETTFYHHATSNKNDFATWIRDVFHDNRLAKEIMKITTPIGMAKKICCRIEVLQKW